MWAHPAADFNENEGVKTSQWWSLTFCPVRTLHRYRKVWKCFDFSSAGITSSESLHSSSLCSIRDREHVQEMSVGGQTVFSAVKVIKVNPRRDLETSHWDLVKLLLTLHYVPKIKVHEMKGFKKVRNSNKPTSLRNSQHFVTKMWQFSATRISPMITKQLPISCCKKKIFTAGVTDKKILSLEVW